jgi:hypothetical protein
MKHQRANILILSLTIILLPSILFAWSVPYDISKNDTSVVTYSSPCVAADRNGIAHVVWEAWRSDNYWGPRWIMYSSGQDTNWAIPIWLSEDTPSVSSATPCIVIDKNNRPFVGWSDESKGQMYYSYLSGGVWTTPKSIGNGFYGLRMVVDKYNVIHAVWHNANYSIWYSYWNGVKWAVPVNIEPDTNIGLAWPDIAIDSKSYIHITAMDYTRSQGYPLAHYKGKAHSWVRMFNPPDTSMGHSCFPRIAVGYNDTIYVVWEERVPYTPDGYWSFYNTGKDNLWSKPYHLDTSAVTPASYEPQIIFINRQVYCAWTAGVKNMGDGLRWTMRDSAGQWQTTQVLCTQKRAYSISLCHNRTGKIDAVWANAGWIEYGWMPADTGGWVDKDTVRYLVLTVLGECRPNPFSGSATITYQLNNPERLWLNIYNILGQLKKSMDLGYQPRGIHEVKIFADQSFSNGVYFYQIKTANQVASLKKMVLLK